VGYVGLLYFCALDAFAKNVAVMGWYCPKCRTSFVEFQSSCPYCLVPLKKSKYEDRL